MNPFPAGTTAALTPSDTARLAAGVVDEIEKAVVGRRRPLELVLLGVLGRGHVRLTPGSVTETRAVDRPGRGGAGHEPGPTEWCRRR